MAITVNSVAAQARQLRGLLDMVNFLATHHAVPIPTTITVEVHAPSDLDGFEKVARAAHHLGVTALSTPNGTQRASRKFGPVTYAVVYHPIHPAVTP